jgi:hypothetical protein
MSHQAVPPREETTRSEKCVKRQTEQEARKYERERAARRRRTRRLATRAGMLLIVASLLAGVGWWVLRPKPGTYVPSQGNAHISGEGVGFRYASDPPTSGPHFTGMARWGVHDQPVSKTLQIHNLEDGGVLVQHSCSDCDDLISKLKDVVRRYPDKIILAPYPGMKTRIALTAWSYVDREEETDMRRQNALWTGRVLGSSIGAMIALTLGAEAGELSSQAKALLDALERGPGPTKGDAVAPVTLVAASVEAAIAAECADQQGTFWPYHDRLFASGGIFALSAGSLKKYAAELGLDAAQFGQCVAAPQTREKVERETLAARAIGMTGTPAFLINGKRMIGAQPPEVFEQILEAMLKEREAERARP